ncbi:hypothetical protein BJX96DRAFT_152663 [Aspergillus floccosus]
MLLAGESQLPRPVTSVPITLLTTLRGGASDELEPSGIEPAAAGSEHRTSTSGCG